VRKSVPAWIALAVIALAGCGGHRAPEGAIRATINHFKADIGRGDYAGACPLTTGQLRTVCVSLRAEGRFLSRARCSRVTPETELGQMCASMERYASALSSYASLTISKVTISGHLATVAFSGSTEVMGLESSGGRWLISSAIGPVGGAPSRA
jgi:hypothetical protein